MSSRRSFLAAIAGAVAGAAAYDPERALWVPGAKLISIPRPAPVVDPPLWLQPPFHFTKEWERSLAHMRRLNEEYDALFSERRWERAGRVQLIDPDGTRRVVRVRQSP